MGKVKDLTYSKDQRKLPLKEIIKPDGTIQKVPMRKWFKYILRNPKSETANKARKDPDLKQAKVKFMRNMKRNMFHNNRIKPKEILDPSRRRRRQPIRRRNLTMAPVRRETALRRSLIRAEEGKFSGYKKKETKEEDKSKKE